MTTPCTFFWPPPSLPRGGERSKEISTTKREGESRADEREREGKEAAKRGPGTHDCEREEREATFKT